MLGLTRDKLVLTKDELIALAMKLGLTKKAVMVKKSDAPIWVIYRK